MKLAASNSVLVEAGVFNLRPMKVRLALLVAVRMCVTVLSKI